MEFEKMKRIAVFSGSSNPRLSDEIAHELGISLGNVKLEKFANGEIYARYLESVRGADVFIVQSVCSSPNGLDVNDNLMELLIMIDAAKRASAHSVSAVITHYGYARQDHKPVNHMTAMPIFVDYYKAMGFDPEELCVVSPDVGRAKAAKKFSTLLDCDIAIMHKDRPKHNQAEITALIGNVEGKVCILNDDMIDTAGSLVAAATTLKAKGAKKVFACATHGLFSGPAYDRIENSCIEEVVVTDAVPVPLERQTGKIKVLTLAPLFAQTIKNVYSNGSVASLFE